MKNPLKGMKIGNKADIQIENILPKTIAPTVLPENQYKWMLINVEITIAFHAYFDTIRVVNIAYHLQDKKDPHQIMELRIAIEIPQAQTPLQRIEERIKEGFPHDYLRIRETQMAVGLPFDYENKQENNTK